LGAGTAAMLGLLWYTDDQMMEIGFKVYPLAPPLIFSTEFNEHMAKVITSVVFGNDTVARLCLGAV